MAHFKSCEVPIKVLHVIGNLDIGGAQEVVRTLVEHLASGNCIPLVCTLKDGPLRREIEGLGIEVTVLPSRRYSIVAFPLFVADMFRILHSLTRLVNEYGVDVMQTHLLRSLDFLVLFLKYTTTVRVVLWTFHSANFALSEGHLSRHKWLLKPKRNAHRQLYKLASRWVSGFVVVSDQVKENLLDYIGPVQGKVTVIYNGVDIKRYGQLVDRALVRKSLGLEACTRLIVMVGTLRYAKGHRYLIDAMSLVAPRHPDLHVLFIGNGELGAELHDRARKLNLDDRIHFLGNRHDVPELLATSDLFVLPSLWEGLSMALLEAMATGLPIVASEVSGTVQAITPNESGILVPPGNSQELAKAIERVLNDPVGAQAMGSSARQRVAEELSAQRQANEHLALYHRLLQEEAKQCPV